MRDDSHRWESPRAADAEFDLGDATLAPVRPKRQMLISGPDVLRQAEGPLVAWPGAAPDAPYTLCLRRDRVLAVNGPDLTEGWNQDRRQAVSDMTDAYCVFDLSGPGAMGLLMRGAELNPDIPSRSVARLLFGLGVFLYRRKDAGPFRLHVARARAQTLVESFEEAAAHAGA